MSRGVLIIGASSAIAAQVARRCAAAGDRLYLIARRPAALEALVAELGPAVIGHAQADLDELERAPELISTALACFGEPGEPGSCDVALIAHGRLGDQLLSERDFEEAEATLRTNLLSAVALLIPLANAFEARGAGHIGVITSVAGQRGRPRNYTYGAAKGGLSHYLEGLRSRLYPRGVSVHDLRLGPVDTPMTRDHDKTWVFAQPDRVADAIVRALAGRRFVVYVPWPWRVVMVVVRLVPEPLFQRLGFLSGR